MNKLSFKGPLFIVGSGRSGTKLLREILNNHPSIALADEWTNLINILNYAKNNSDNNKPVRISRIYKIFRRSYFYRRQKRLENKVITLRSITDRCNSVQEFVQEICKHYAYGLDNVQSQEYIWGNKTPGYENHLPLIKEFFSDAKFVHMIRDPRDIALSYKKTWGKSIHNCSYKWNKSIQNAYRDKAILGDDYIEVMYEELISNPENTMIKLSDFLNCEFDSTHLKFQKSIEDKGDTNEKSYILATNRNKWRRGLSDFEIEMIERLTKPSMILLGYNLVNKDIRYFYPAKLWVLYHKLFDLYKEYLFLIKRKLDHLIKND